METECLVYVDLSGKAYLAGRLWARMRKDKESATFEYDKEWLKNPVRFSLEPALALGPGPFHTVNTPLFGALGDSAPDRWGRMLMRRAERHRARREGQTARTLKEIDYLLMVDDEARQGALRFAIDENGPFLAEGVHNKIPPLIELPRLLTATEHVLSDKESDEDLRLLLAPGSSLGGARPKASVRDRDGQLAFAKFPNKEDEYNTVAWEAVALKLAGNARIEVPNWRLESIGKKTVLLLRRFDRADKTRIPFLSAMSMVNAKDNEQRSYLELVDALRQYGAAANNDIRMLWRRIVFSILISNTDDHLRNHGFLYTGTAGWRLSPAYDLNPVPVDIRPRILTTAIDLDDSTASLDLALSVAGYFDLPSGDALEIAAEVGAAVSKWRRVAADLGLFAKEIDRMASAFEHEDLALACKAKKRRAL
ncbi:MAG: type II toxin-antitoxin system HipA family toxin [Candidatus Obscuribacterales bacterium]|nr:type II toxin-antitoxin system HipA family toxin [Candidatus Obscuribacterales bacterium]